MGNFKDFDLDLRNVASGGEAEPNGLSKITTKITIGVSKMSLKNKCKSVDTRQQEGQRYAARGRMLRLNLSVSKM